MIKRKIHKILRLLLSTTCCLVSISCEEKEYIPVTDTKTGLIWTRCPVTSDGGYDTTFECGETNGRFTWEEAISVCRNLNYNRDSYDWRLPNIRELSTLVTIYQTTSPMIDLNAFPDTGDTLYWSSTTYHSRKTVGYDPEEFTYAYAVDFMYGNVSAFLKTKNNESFVPFQVRCVAGP